MIAYTVLVSFGMRTVSFLERLFSPGIGSYAANLTEVKTRMPNAKVLSEKQAIVASLTEKLQGAAAGIIVDYKGITVDEDTKLRTELRQNDVEYSVVKNTLTRFALKDAGLEAMSDLLNGTTSLATSTADPIVPIRMIHDMSEKMAKDNKFIVKGAFLEGKVLNDAEIAEIAQLQNKDALYSKVLGTMLAPITGLAVCLNQVVEQMGGAAAPAAEAEAPAAE